MSDTNKLLGILLSCVLLASSAQVAFAQNEPTTAKQEAERQKRSQWGKDQMKMRLELMTQGMSLTKAQQAKIKPILEDEFNKLQALQGNDKLNRDQRRVQLQALNEATYEQIKPILTPDQLKKHENLKKIIKMRRTQQRATRPAPGPNSGPTLSDPVRRVKHLADDLKLSEEQQAKIKPIVTEEFVKLEDIRGNDGLNRDERRVRLQELNLATYEKIKPLLTPEQLKKYDEISNKIKDRRSLKKGPTAAAQPPN